MKSDMLLPFKKEIERAFREDRNLPKKLLGAVVVGLSAGLTTWLDRTMSAAFHACMMGACVLISVVAVLALSFKDVVRQQIDQGEPVHPMLRLYFASGRLSLVLWIATVLVGAFFGCMLWPL